MQKKQKWLKIFKINHNYSGSWSPSKYFGQIQRHSLLHYWNYIFDSR